MQPAKPTGRYARIAGCWCAWAEAGATVEEIKRRIAQCPQSMQETVRRHCRTTWALRNHKRTPG